MGTTIGNACTEDTVACKLGTIEDENKSICEVKTKIFSDSENLAFGCQNFISENRNNICITTQQNNNLQVGQDHTNGFLPAKKIKGYVRVLYCNPNGFNMSKSVKVQQLFRYCFENDVDVVAMAETTTKWSSREVYRFENEVRKLTTKARFVTSYSKLDFKSPTNYLPGGTATFFTAPVSHSIKTDPFIDKLGRWQAVTVTENDVSLLIITVYRLPNTSNPGPKTTAS